MRNVKRVFKNIFALLVFAVLLCLVDLRELARAFSQLTAASIAQLLLLSVFLVYVSAWKWKLFLRELSQEVKVYKLFNLYLVGYFVNLIVPSYVGGDAVRSYYVGKKVGQHEAAAATILERYTGLVAMVMLALISMTISDLVTWQIRVAIFVLLAGTIAVTLLALSPKLLALCSRLPAVRIIEPHLNRIQDALRLAVKNPPLMAKTLGLSFLYHSLTVVNTSVAAWAIGWHNPPGSELFVVLPLVLIIGAIPVAPSGLGIQEGAFFYFLQGIGATPAQALGVGLVLRLKSYLIAMVGGIIWMFLRDKPKEAVARSPS